MSYEMDQTDRIGEWIAVLESRAEADDHPYRRKKYREIADHLRRCRACEVCGEAPDAR